MASLNKTLIIGNLTRDPELRRTAKGTAVGEIGIAINRTFAGSDGQKTEETTFVDVVLWSRLAELAEQYLKKGSPVFIEGRLQLDTWDDKATGQKRSRLRVVGEKYAQFLGGRPDSEPRQESAPAQRREKQEDKWAAPDMADDDLAF